MQASLFSTLSLATSLTFAGACGASSAPSKPLTTPVARAEVAAPTSLPRSPGEVTGALDLLPTGITSFGAAVHEGSLYALGGFYGEPHKYVPEFQSSAFMRLSLDGKGRWETLPGLEAGLQSVALVSAADGLHRLGGMRIRGPEDLHSLREHARFVNGAWESLPDMPDARSSHDAVVVGETIYVVGGWKLDGDRAGTFYDDMWIFNADTGWEKAASPVSRRALALAATADHLVAIGGLTDDREVSARVDLYDIEAGSWSEGPAFPGENNGFGVAAVAVGDSVYASGRDGIVWSLRPGEAAWQAVSTLTFPRFFHRLAANGGELLALGGIGGMHTFGRTRHIERIAVPGKGSPTPSLVQWTLPAPGPAKNRQGVFLAGDRLMVFGGNNSMGQHDFEAENFLDTAYVVHLPSLSVSQAPAYPAKRQTMQTLTVEDTGISVGGFGHDGEVARTHPQAYSYDFASETWCERPGLPVARSQFGLVQHEDQLWVFGGLDYDPTREGGDQFRHLTSLLKAPLDGSAPFKDTGLALPGPRRAFGGAYLDGKYYVVGGMRGGFALVEDCQVFDFAKKRWSAMACPANLRLNPEFVPVGDEIVLVGGSTQVGDTLSEDATIEVYSPKNNTWRRLEVDLPFSPKHMRAFAYRGKLLIYSAHNDAGAVHLGLVSLGGESKAIVPASTGAAKKAAGHHK